ncbi:MAG: helix-turn-helix domain-containing protein [Candidatus Dormibacteria bacterium]
MAFGPVFQEWIPLLQGRPTAFAVLFVLAAHAEHKTGRVWLRADTLASATGLGRSAVYYALNFLRDAGIVSGHPPNFVLSYKMSVGAETLDPNSSYKMFTPVDEMFTPVDEMFTPVNITDPNSSYAMFTPVDTMFTPVNMHIRNTIQSFKQRDTTRARGRAARARAGGNLAQDAWQQTTENPAMPPDPPTPQPPGGDMGLTNIRAVGDADDETNRASKLHNTVPVTRDQAALKRCSLHLSQHTKQPPCLTGKDRARWRALLASYGADGVCSLIDDAMAHRAKMQFGEWADAHITPAAIEYYAKTFYRGPSSAPTPETERAVLDTLIQKATKDGITDLGQFHICAAMSGLSAEHLYRQHPDVFASLVLSGALPGSGVTAEVN